MSMAGGSCPPRDAALLAFGYAVMDAFGRWLLNAERCLGAGESVSPPGYVYFVTAGENVKIGYSTSIRERLSQIQTGNPVPITSMKSVVGDRHLEQRIHDMLSGSRVQGEWFSGPLVKKFVELIPA